MNLVWLTDIHLNFVTDAEAQVFATSIARQTPDALLITGDIGEADTVSKYLRMLASEVSCPVYFVLGNHDYYRGSIESVRTEMRALVFAEPRLVYLTRSGVQHPGDTTCLIGHDGWPDGRLGDFAGSQVLLNDFLLIRDFRRPNSNVSRLDPEVKQYWLTIMQRLADEAAMYLDEQLSLALSQGSCEQLVVATHVPPFRGAALYKGKPSNDEFLPFFSCKAIGDVLLKHAALAPTVRFIVFCGHTHSTADYLPLPNMRVFSGRVEYGSPAIQKNWSLE